MQRLEVSGAVRHIYVVKRQRVKGFTAARRLYKSFGVKGLISVFLLMHI
jgi:hypothetical protein